MRRILIMAAALLASADQLVAATNTRFENFNSDPGWEGRNNRATVPGQFQINQNFGFSASTNNAGGSGENGEIGGRIHGAAEAAYYAKVLTPLTLNDSFNLKGDINVQSGFAHALIGFFNNTTINEWRTPNSVALRIWDGVSGANTFDWYAEYATSQWRAGAGPFGSVGNSVLSTGVKRAFELDYDPNGGGGLGTMSGTIGDQSFSVNLAPGHKADGATFNRLGILNVMKSADLHGNIWLDNLEITINNNPTIVETFTTDPGWESLRNRPSNGGSYFTTNVRPRFNFGFSNTNHAGGAAQGEMGGLIWNGDSEFPADGSRMAYYGDPLDTTLNINQPLVAAGKITLHRRVSDSETLIGFFHSTDSNRFNSNELSPLPENFVGATIGGTSADGFFFYPTYAADQESTPTYFNGAGSTNGAPHIFPNGDTYDWSIVYDPNANSGIGAITVTLDGQSATMNLQQIHRNVGANFNRFGIITTHVDGNGQTIYFDDVTYTVAAAGPQWEFDGSGNWHTALNWLGGVPNGVGAVATFGDLYLGSAGRTVFAHTAVTVGTLNFNRGSAYVLSGLGSLTMQVSSGSAVVNVEQGTHKINLPLVIASNTTLNVTTGATLQIADPVTVGAGRSLSQAGGGTVEFLSTVTLLDGASASFGSSQQLELLSIGANAVVDLTDAGLVMEGGSYGGLKELVKQGFGGGDWSGQGITSSTAQNDPRDATGVGIVDNGAIGHSQFAGISGLDGNEVLVGYTYYGDADLSGRIELDDFQQFLIGYHGGPDAADANWLVGDFDYDSVVDLEDFELLVRGLRYQPSPRLSSELLAAVTQFAHDEGIDVDLSPVPEPRTAGVMLLGACALLLRRRRVRSSDVSNVFKRTKMQTAGGLAIIYFSLMMVLSLSTTSALAAASGAGELGGTIRRDSEPAHFYGYDIGTLNLDNSLFASGVIRTTSAGGGGSYFLGFFRGADSYNPNGGGAKNFAGYYMDDGVNVWAIMYDSDGNDDYSQASALNLPFGPSAQPAWFTMNYDPAGNGGGGTLILNVNGNVHVHNLAAGFKSQLQDFTHFGILGQSIDGSNSSTAYWDDFTFTTSSPPSGGSIWNLNQDGDWFVPGNWSNAVPNAIDAEATFSSGGATITENFNTTTDSTWDRLNNRTAPQNYGWSNTDNTGSTVSPPAPVATGGSLIYAHSPITLGKVHFSNANTYLLDGAGSLTLQVSAGSALVDVQQGTHKINLPLHIASDTELAVSSGATLKISDPITVAAGRNLTQSGTGSVNYESTISIGTGASMEFVSSSHAARLAMATGSSMQLSSIASTALRVDRLSIASGAQLNLGNNELVVHGGAPLQEAFVSSGATFSGDGALVVEENRTLELQDAADVDVVVENQGRIELGFGSLVGQSEGLAFQQSATGKLAIDLGGTGLDHFDRMTLTGAAQLGGVLDVALVSGFVPSLGQSFNILSATGGVSGFFAQMNQPPGLPAGLLLDVVYSQAQVQLRVVGDLAGDYNRNGVVDAADYIVWRDKQGQAVTPLSSADGNGDGIVDSDDYAEWRSHFGQTASALAQSLPSSQAAVPEPGTAGLLAALWLGACALVRCQRK